MATVFFGNSTTGTLCLAPPAVCLYNLETVRVAGVPAQEWLEGATEYVLQLWTPTGNAWADAATLESPGEAAVVEFAYENGALARWKVALSGTDIYSAESPLDTFCCYGVLPPEVPAAPVLEKSCEGPVVGITSPAFSTVENHETQSIEIRRRIAGSDVWETVHSFTSATSWDDESVEAAANYQYQARACNDAGCSEWSATAAISLQSTTTLAIVSPAAGTLAGSKRLRLSAAGPVTNARLFWNGVLLGTPILKDGFYLFDWNTPDSSQGSGTLRFQATGGDGCDNYAEAEYTLANPAAALTNHIDVVCREGVAPVGMQVKSAALRFQAQPLPASARQRYFLRAAAYLDDGAANDPFALEFDEESWEAGQPLLLQQGRRLDDGTTQWTWFDVLAKKEGVTGKRAIFRLRFDVGESLTGFSTFGAGSNARIVNFQTIGQSEDDDYRVFFLARKQNGSGARVYQFDGQTVELLYDLADEPYSAPGAFDCALLGDKLFVAAGSELFYIDTDSGDASADLTPRGETRAIAHLAVMGNSVFALFNGDDDCQCYRFDGNSWKATWTLPVTVDKAYSTTVAGSSYLMLASGAALYAASGTAQPAVAHSFGSDITALHERFIGLADGKLYEFIENQWLLRASRTEPVLATAQFAGTTHEIGDPRGVAGENSPTLLEATTNPAAWTANRTLQAPPLMEESVTAVTSLHRFLKQLAPAQGDPNTPGYVPAQFQEVLLLGTAPDGLLLLLETNEIARSPLAVEATQVSAVHAMTVVERQ